MLIQLKTKPVQSFSGPQFSAPGSDPKICVTSDSYSTVDEPRMVLLSYIMLRECMILKIYVFQKQYDSSVFCYHWKKNALDIDVYTGFYIFSSFTSSREMKDKSRSVRATSCKSGQHDWYRQHKQLTPSSVRF